MQLILRNMTIAAVVLSGFSLIGTAIVAYTEYGTKARIEHSARETLKERIHQLVPANRFDNDITTDTTKARDAALLGTEQPIQVYRARQAGKPVAVLLTPVAPDGYSGNIELLVAIWHDGSLAGVRVLAHKETPGLGDYIDEHHGDWIFGFNGRSLQNPDQSQWKVKKDGGQFDYITGATITPRAVVKAVKNSLLYYQQHRDELFATPAQEPHR